MAAAVLAGIVSHASAAILTPGNSIFTPGEADPTGGAVVANIGPLTLSSANYTGTLQSTVISGDPSNPFPGGLTFIYQLHNNATSVNDLERFTIPGFAGFSTDVSYQTGSGVPSTATSRDSGGDVMGYDFISAPVGSGALHPGQTSDWMVIQTNATTITNVQASVIDGTVTNVNSLAPSPAAGIPEPATLSLALLGTAGLVLRRRR
jgi:hypothetical protein